MSAPSDAFHAQRSDIDDWAVEAKDAGATHLIVAFDRFSGDSYPLYVMPGETVPDRVAALDEYQRVDEVIPLGSVEKVRDDSGHEHGSDGKFTSGNGVSAAPKYQALPYGESVKLARAGGVKGVPIPNMPPNRAHNMERLRDKLLDVGGNAVHIEPDDAETTLIFKNGKLFDSPVENAEKDRPDCHGYTARYWWAHRHDPKVKFCTGYATAEHGIWVRHSWIEKDGKILEQTAPRKQYFGVELTPEQAELYIAMRDGIAPGGPLLATPVKRIDYVNEMHARGRGEGKSIEELSGGREVQR